MISVKLGFKKESREDPGAGSEGVTLLDVGLELRDKRLRKGILR